VIAVRKENEDEYVVLALVDGKDAAVLHDPYATWIANQNGTFWGHYFDNFVEAAHDFDRR
jgi:hypothetical protein